MLAISPIVDDEPAASAATAPKLDKPAKYDAREINRRALQLWPVLQHHIFDHRGFALGEVARLSPTYVRTDPGRVRPHGTPRLSELRGPSPHDDGSWCCLSGTAGRGEDVISLVQALAPGADRRTVAEWLRGICARLVEIA
jgi:hypothetical protein